MAYSTTLYILFNSINYCILFMLITNSPIKVETCKYKYKYIMPYSNQDREKS